ncbi:MAG: isoprenylcysteine carboxylmethyltransferase family protein [bacterium]|nr:isoprenylcysteine carboxylmethyltransferase family protein [bacterium]MDT8365409.1 isoprenylcysteine carboxylmethyltransferase family protein [bacterium]
MKLFYLALLWSLWCALHSLLISRVVVSRLKERYKDRYRFHRVFFNLVSILTLTPVLIYSNSLRGDPFFSWSGAWRPVQLFLVMGAIVLFYAGGKHYDLWQFLGIRQATENESKKGLTETGGIDTSGILGVIRHPWYMAAILILWARPLDITVLVTNAVLTAYLFVGTVLEERKLVEEFGEEYRDYKKRVPMFFPWRRGNNNG